MHLLHSFVKLYCLVFPERTRRQLKLWNPILLLPENHQLRTTPMPWYLHCCHYQARPLCKHTLLQPALLFHAYTHHALQDCGGMEWEEKVRGCPLQANPLLKRWEDNEGVILPWVWAPALTWTVCPALEPFPHSRAFHTSIIIISSWKSTIA